MLLNKIKCLKFINALPKLGKVIEPRRLIENNKVLEIRKTEVIVRKISKYLKEDKERELKNKLSFQIVLKEK